MLRIKRHFRNYCVPLGKRARLWLASTLDLWLRGHILLRKSILGVREFPRTDGLGINN